MAFVDLVKAYDSVKHDIITARLDKMGAPKKFITRVENPYENCNINLKIRKEEVIIEHGYGVKQGDNLAPTLFVIDMQLAVEDILLNFKLNNLDLTRMKCEIESSGTLKVQHKK